jgi:hypothetical protein
MESSRSTFVDWIHSSLQSLDLVELVEFTVGLCDDVQTRNELERRVSEALVDMLPDGKVVVDAFVKEMGQRWEDNLPKPNSAPIELPDPFKGSQLIDLLYYDDDEQQQEQQQQDESQEKKTSLSSSRGSRPQLKTSFEFETRLDSMLKLVQGSDSEARYVILRPGESRHDNKEFQLLLQPKQRKLFVSQDGIESELIEFAPAVVALRMAWHSVKTIPSQRCGHTATALSRNGVELIGIGCYCCLCLCSILQQDPVLLVLGGSDSQRHVKSLSEGFLYNPSTDKWGSVSIGGSLGPLHTRRGHAVVQVEGVELLTCDNCENFSKLYLQIDCL